MDAQGEKVVVGAIKGDEIADNRTVHFEFTTKKSGWIAALAEFPVVLAVEDVLLREWDFEHKADLWQKRDLEGKRDHGAEMRHADDSVCACDPTKLGKRAVKIRKWNMLKDLERAGDVK